MPLNIDLLNVLFYIYIYMCAYIPDDNIMIMKDTNCI